LYPLSLHDALPIYLGDVLPLLAVAGSAGLVLAVRWLQDHAVAWRRSIGAVMVVLGLFGTAVALGHGLWYQLVYAAPGDQPDTAQFFEWRTDLPRPPFGEDQPVVTGPVLPTTGAPGQVFVAGDCDRAYAPDGRAVDT